MKLTTNQQAAYDNLKTNRTLYISLQSRPIIRTFDALVAKGFATSKKDGMGKRYTVNVQ